MAVPKKKTSKSRRNMRRSHLALDKLNIVTDANSGEYTLPHRMCLIDGTYKGKQIIKKNILREMLASEE
jgi:large subunit ribosomal protein L32